MGSFHQRRDNQIMNLELLSIAYGGTCWSRNSSAVARKVFLQVFRPSLHSWAAGILSCFRTIQPPRPQRRKARRKQQAAYHGLAECGTGRAKAFDQSCIVHSIWLLLAKLRCGAWIERVPTLDNLADLPSRQVRVSIPARSRITALHVREDYRLLQQLNPPAIKMQGVLEASFWESGAWEELSVKRALLW